MRLPDCKFYLFGMGNRRKLLYKQGMLLDALTGESIRKWDVASENVQPSEYAVNIETRKGRKATVKEDETGVWIEDDGERIFLTRSRLRLPSFERSKRPSMLRVLHHEILVNIVNGKPVPNLLAYPKPWYRDAAVMCMCVEKTGNLHVVEDWIFGLKEPFDRNNAGDCEPDNLGQVLYMISLVSDPSHPLVDTILNTVPQFRKGNHIIGLTDHSERPVYQTKWLKFGLKSLGLDDPYEVPEVFDEYSALFWMDFRKEHVDGSPFSDEARMFYPYLGWAEAHFHGWSPPMEYSNGKYPLTWEAHASQADYDRMALISEDYVNWKICAPHAWRAAEMFLYLFDRG